MRTLLDAQVAAALRCMAGGGEGGGARELVGRRRESTLARGLGALGTRKGSRLASSLEAPNLEFELELDSSSQPTASW